MNQGNPSFLRLGIADPFNAMYGGFPDSNPAQRR